MFKKLTIKIELKKKIDFLILSLTKIFARLILGRSFIKSFNQGFINPKIVTINFLHSKINLGDLLFFIPLIIELQKRCDEVVIIVNELQLNILQCFISNKYYENIIFRKYFLKKKIKNL